ncbi:YecA family protein [Marinomonas agarivorans]|nr:YecA family protein [Marinomonas agarivorans]
MSTEMLKDALDFDLLADVFVTESIAASPAELHGQLCGYLASGVSLPLEDWLKMVVEFCELEKWQQEDSRTAIVELYSSTIQLFKNGEYALDPVMADEDSSLANRGFTLAEWAHGFLAGYGLSGRKEDISIDAQNVLKDFANISAMKSEMKTLEDNNDNEKDLMELIEYVRLSAMMLYAEHHGVEVDPKVQTQIH